LLHRTNGAVLAERVERAVTVLQRMRGLLGRDTLPEGEALVIDPCTSIHTFFMRFAIDAAFLSRDGRVVRAISAMKPWRATRLYPSAAMVVELPAGTLARTATSEGDELVFETEVLR
jgi:uncharacterized membrane protein (UPF0127 family)